MKELKPARELPISRGTSKLLEEVDKQLKNLTTDVRHTYGREFIMLLLEMRRLIRKANAAQTLEEKAFHVERFTRRYNSLAGFLVHTYSYNIRCRAWYSIDQETKTYLEQPPWDFTKIQPLNQYKSINKLKISYYAQSKFTKRGVG